MSNFFNIQKIMTFFNYIFWLFILNLVFLVLNIPLVSFFMSVGISNIGTYLPLFLLLAIPFGPSLAMLLYCTNKLVKNKDLDIIQDIKLGFKLNFKQSLTVWCLELAIIFILHTNIRFFSRYSIILTGVFVLLSIVLLLITPYLFMLISKFSMSTKNIVTNSIILVFTRPLITFANILCCVATLIFFEITPGTAFLFLGSLLTFLISYSNKFLLNELEEASIASN